MWRQIYNPVVCLFTLGCSLGPARAAAADNDYYSTNYDLARSRFRAAVTAQSQVENQAKSWQFDVPSRTEKDLTVDYFYLPAKGDSDRLVVITSGVHGVEGFTGSAIQLMFLNEFGTQLDRRRTGYLIVHTLNPYGFKHHRRATENNVNLNRNFSVTDQLYQTPNAEYAKLKSILEPAGPVKYSLLNLLKTGWQFVLRSWRGEGTVYDLDPAIGQGQFQSPSGLEYGGTQAEPQIADFLIHLKSGASKYREVILLDLHTGLGENGILHLMPGDRDKSVDPELFEKLFKTEQDKSIYRFTPNTTEGFYPTHGDLNNVVPDLLSPNQKCVAVTLEFGTLGSSRIAMLKTLNRLILENQGFHHGYANARIEAIVRRDFTQQFYPAEQRWRNGAIAKARNLFEVFLKRLN